MTLTSNISPKSPKNLELIEEYVQTDENSFGSNSQQMMNNVSGFVIFNSKRINIINLLKFCF